METTKIRQLWDLFVLAESSSYEKSNWCDIFLSQLIVDLNDGKSAEEILTFCNWSGVGTLIGCQLLSDVDQVCSEPGDGDDLRPLRHHLFAKGWRALLALFSLGQQNFSCSNELANLLISLFPICLEAEDWNAAKSRNKYLRLNTDYEVDSFFASSPSNAKCIGNSVGRGENFRLRLHPANARNRRSGRGPMNARWNENVQSSESENLCDDANFLDRSFAFKIKFDPANSRSDDDSRLDSVLYEPRKRSENSKKFSPIDFTDEKIEEVMMSRVSPYEFSMLVIQLLISFSRSENCFAIATENSYSVCLKSVKFSLENLCSIQFGSASALESLEVANLKSGLTQLLVVSLGKVTNSPDVTDNVIFSGVVPMTVRVLEDSVCKLASEIDLAGISDKDRSLKEKEHQVVFGLTCTVITFLFSLLMKHDSDGGKVRNFSDLFRTFIESDDGKLIEKIVVTLSTFGNASRAKKVIDLIGQLVASIKKVRNDIVNPEMRRKPKEKKWKSGNELHHHHDLFGSAFVAPPAVGSSIRLQNCCVSSLFLVLARLLGKTNQIATDVTNRILKTMTSCGTCCCFPTNNLLQSLLEIIKLPSQKSRILVFQLLENILYRELGCYSTPDGGKTNCLVCPERDLEGNNRKLNSLDEIFVKRGDSVSANGENFLVKNCSSPEGDEPKKTGLKLDLFRDLLSAEDFRVVQGVTCHLLKCAPKMSRKGKHTVLFDIFLPIFTSRKIEFFSRRDDISIFLISSSLSMFSSLLNNLDFAQEFINKKGLDHVLDLITVPNFAGNCCSVLEKTIVMSILISDVGDVGSVPSLVTLKNAADSAVSAILKKFDEVDELSNASAAPKRKWPNAEKCEEEESRKMMDVLENASTFWKTYANLTLCSPILRKYFSGESFLGDSNKLLQISLFFLTSKLNEGREKSSKSRDGIQASMLIKLIESLLTFILSTSESKENGDRDDGIVVEKLSRSLLSSCDFRNLDVRKLAEVLVKCSLVQPSQFQMMPSDSPPKLLFAPLWTTCKEVADSDVSEEKISEPESLDENYVTADEGYDGDVEVRDNFTSPGEVFDENPLQNVTESIAFLSKNEKLDKRTGNLIVHPKLCLLAIDLLVKSYREKYENDSGDDVLEERTGSGGRNHLEKTFTSEAMEGEKTLKFRFSKESPIRSEGETMAKKFGECKIDDEQSVGRSKADLMSEEMFADSEEKYLIGLISVFQRLVSLCRDEPRNCAILCKNNVILKLLNGFEGCLTVRKESFSELQKSVLDLITVLAKYSIAPEELSTYLAFFKHDNPHLDQLINPLLNLITSYSPQPNLALRFPVAIPRNFIHNSITDIGKNIHVRHKSEGIFSCWSLSAISLPIGSELNWAVWAQGFSLSLWLKVDKSAGGIHGRSKTCRDKRKSSKGNLRAPETTADVRSNENSNCFPSKVVRSKDLLHVFSIGNDGLTLECWCETDSDGLTWRLSKLDGQKGYEVMAEETAGNCIPGSLWNHLAINVRDFANGKKTVVEVVAIVNGGNEVRVFLPFSGVPNRRFRASSLLLGTQGITSRKGAFSFCTVMLFANPVFTRERAVYLFGLGPNCTNLTDCHVGRRRPNFTSIFSMKNLANEIDWTTILDSKGEIIREPQNHLLIIYSAENPHFFNVYPSSSGMNSSTLFAGLRSISSDSRASQQTPISLVPCIFAPLIHQKYHGLIRSAYILGGSATFMFLFARVVELSRNADEQAKFLFLLLKFVQSDCELFTQFIKSEHHKMLHKIFSVSKCLSGLHILKAILDACCDKPIVVNAGGRFQIIHQSDSIIVNSFLITTILSCWKDWSPALQTNEVLELLFSALLSLLKDDHPFREFNVAQLNRVRMVKGLLSFIKERLLYDDKKRLARNVCISMVELVKSLMGAPPEYSHIVAVMDCLILLHPVNATFVTHVKNTFYVLLSAGQTYRAKGNNRETKSRSQNGESDDTKNGCHHQFSDDSIFDINSNGQARKSARHKRSRKKAIDSNKLSKAMANLQLKRQNRKEMERKETLKNGRRSDELDSNRYSDDLTLDSGIAGSLRENLDETDEMIVREMADRICRRNPTADDFISGRFGQSTETKMNDFFMKTSDEDEEKCEKERERGEVEMHENCGPQCVIVEGLLLLLRDVILVLPDSMAQQILNFVIKPEILLVMANHKDHRVRSAVVRVFSSYLERCSDEDVNRFVKMRGFFHLANQISLFPASRRLVEDCLNLLTRRSVSMETGNFVSDEEVNFFGLASVPPLLALLPRSVHDLNLARNLVGIIRRIYCRDEFTSKVLLENGLLEILVKTLLASAHFGSETNEENRQNLILMDLLEFFVIISNKALSTSGVANLQIVSDMRLELNYVMKLEMENCGSNSRCVKVIRDASCKILEKSLDLMMDKINSFQTVRKSRNSIFSSVLNGVQGERTESEGTDFVDGFSNELGSSSHCLVAYPTKEISRSELTERFKLVIVNAVEFLVFSEKRKSGSDLLGQTELGFVYHLLPMLLKLLSASLEKGNSNRRRSCSGIYSTLRETLKAETFELLIWLMSPRQTVKIRMFAVITLMSQSNYKNLLSGLLHCGSNEAERKFAVFLWDLTRNDRLTNADSRSCRELNDSIRTWGIVSSRSTEDGNETWEDVCNGLTSEAERQAEAWAKQMEAAAVRSMTKFDALAKGMSEDAAAMTRSVVDVQNTGRKSFMEEMKMRCGESVHIMVKWRELVGRLTHEKAVWHFGKCHPTFWQVDPTEGPSRVRKRLARCRAEMDERYFLPSERWKLKGERNPEPLSFLFEEQSKYCTSMAMVERLHRNEKIRAVFSAAIVTPATEIPGEVLVGETCIYFVAEDGSGKQTMDGASTAWLFEDVKEIHGRRYELQERAIEIFLVGGNTYFVALETSKERDALMANLMDCPLPNRITGNGLADAMQRWREGVITNWEYLTHLNKLAGRTYNDLMQYPVYPFVLSDYTSPTLDLESETIYRNLRKPMAVQEKKNEQHYIDNYNELAAGSKQVSLNGEPYHYGSHYSNSGTVLHFLVRLPPFTKLMLQYQDRNFDLPDRTFHSLQTTWRLASSESTTDVKELIPEFFFLPEFLVNFQGFDFGVRQNGEPVGDVSLPDWCKNDPRKFILVHRQALESDHVTENLPHWIDLVFGFKQTGKSAVEAINVFHPATYRGFDAETISDPVERTAWETMVKTYGQTPKQLLRTPHPLAVQPLTRAPNEFGAAGDAVKGLKWGSYVGSPAEPEPVVVWRQQRKGKDAVAALVPLATNDVLGLPPFSTCLLQCDGTVNSHGIRAVLLSWGHSDGIIRIKSRKELPWMPLASTSQLDPVTVCVGEPGCDRLWIGHSSGNLTVYKYKFAPDSQESRGVEFSEVPVALQGHKDSVTSIAISRAYSIVVTSGLDGTVIIWDLNHASYVRSLDPLPGPVKIVKVSEGLGDVAVATQCSGDEANPSDSLNLYTVNAVPVGSVAVEETVTAMCFSSAPEGVSINVVACGLGNGVIRLFSTWDLTEIRDVFAPASKHSILSLAYSCDSRLLYVSFRDGTIVVWESPGSKTGSKTSKLITLNV